MNLFLTLLSGICWSIVYIELIRKGFKDNTYGMPLFALGLNFAWEIIYSICTVLIDGPTVQGGINFVWAILDAIIVYTYFKYGKEYLPEKAKKYFIPFSILAFASCFVLQFAFYFHFERYPAAQYSAFAQNAAMSILFLTMLFTRGNTRGQTLLMATAKWIGTLAAAILMGYVNEFNIYILMTGFVCSVFDIAYIVMIRKWKKDEV